MASKADFRLQQYGITLLRVTLGTVFVAHGAQKLFTFGLAGTAGFMGQLGLPFPTLSAGLAIGAELLGGLALVVGLLTRVATLPLAATMLVAILAVHLPSGFFLPQGFEYALTLLGGSVALALAGPGALALDNVVWRSRPATSVVALLRRDKPARAAA